LGAVGEKTKTKGIDRVGVVLGAGGAAARYCMVSVLPLSRVSVFGITYTETIATKISAERTGKTTGIAMFAVGR
jgi:hypothetical protein